PPRAGALHKQGVPALRRRAAPPQPPAEHGGDAPARECGRQPAFWRARPRAMASGAQDAPDAVSLLRAGEGEAAEHGGADRSGQSLTAGSARFRPPVLIALVAAGAVALCVALYPVPSKGAKPKGAALRHLQDDGFCNSQVSGGYAQSYAFQLPAEWQQKCTGQVASTVQAPPTETQFNTQRNWCWHWMKHKGCKDVIASKNWMEAQQLTAGMGLCPPYEEAPIEPVTNAELCSDPGLGQLDDAAADAASALERGCRRTWRSTCSTWTRTPSAWRRSRPTCRGWASSSSGSPAWT
ncbi:unnamed protein product, partial [Prorocentrum cordatum]